jgi:anhydro-N-acetylmuramic acid kinase
MVYKVIGLMSGSSLDGLDIVYTWLDEVRGQWSYEIKHADCIPYTDEWTKELQHASRKSVPEFLRLHTRYGRYIGEQINSFIERYGIDHQVHFIASHGHTALHEPQDHTTCQIGDGATIAAVTGLPVINDLRSLDVALGGQGAPIVPVGDKLLFGGYDYWLNIGGIANVTVPHNNSVLAFDICAANQILNTLAEREGLAMDEDGALASQGVLQEGILSALSDIPYYKLQAPKSLSNEAAMGMVFPLLMESSYNTKDLLHTMVYHIAEQIAAAISLYPSGKEEAQILVTGGGAFNKSLIRHIERAIEPLNIKIVIPDTITVQFKEALVMALIGALRWREETNVYSSVTGATRDSVGGTIWMGHSYNG